MCIRDSSKSAPCAKARLAKSRIRAALPARSPTVAFICAMAILSVIGATINERGAHAPLVKDNKTRSVVRFFLGGAVALNAFHDFFLGFVMTKPAANLDKFSRLQVFVVLKEVRNLIEHNLWEVAG